MSTVIAKERGDDLNQKKKRRSSEIWVLSHPKRLLDLQRDEEIATRTWKGGTVCTQGAKFQNLSKFWESKIYIGKSLIVRGYCNRWGERSQISPLLRRYIPSLFRQSCDCHRGHPGTWRLGTNLTYTVLIKKVRQRKEEGDARKRRGRKVYWQKRRENEKKTGKRWNQNSISSNVNHEALASLHAPDNESTILISSSIKKKWNIQYFLD